MAAAGLWAVKVHVLEARKLTAADMNTFSEDSSDPYVVLFLSDDEEKRWQTRTVEETTDPEWEESFELQDVQASQELRVCVFDHDYIGSDDPLGELTIGVSDALQQWERHGSEGVWLKLVGEGSGEGEVRVGFEFIGDNDGNVGAAVGAIGAIGGAGDAAAFVNVDDSLDTVAVGAGAGGVLLLVLLLLLLVLMVQLQLSLQVLLLFLLL